MYLPERLSGLEALSGEIHYFRIPHSKWRSRILDAKEAGLNAISTYIPWNWHEVEEGSFDFSGSTHPQRNLELFLEIAKEEEMLVIAKPGPYICAEWLYGGVPSWLLERYPEVRALNSLGKPTKWFSKKAPAITYLHPTYVKFAERWVKKVSEVIRRYEASKGGCVFIVQVDNESSYGFHFSPFDADYNPVVVGGNGKEGLYQKWLESKYSSIAQLNRTYGTSYTTFSEVEPPRALKGKRSLLVVLDWLEFKEHMIAEFLHRMAEVIRGAGVNALLVTNEFFIPFFYPPVQAKSKFLVDAADLYPHYLDEDSFLAAVNYLEFFKGCQPETPLLVAELQSGWFSYNTSRNTLHILGRLAHVKGAKLVNFYMFSGGVNPKGFGTTSKLYFKDAPVSPMGERTEKYNTVKLFALATKASRLTTPVYDLHVAYYHRYTLAEITGGCDIFGRKYRSLSSSFRRLLLSLVKNGVSYSVTPISLTGQHHSPLLFHEFDFLAGEEADRLIRHVENGGTLILMPQIPLFDEENNKLDDLAETLGVTCQKVRSGVVRSVDFKERMTSVTVFDVKDAEPLAFLDNEYVCGFKVQLGKGEVIQLGFTPREAFLLKRLAPSLKQACRASGVLACLSRGENGYGLLVCNLERKDVEGVVSLRLPDYESTFSFSFPARGGAIWPIRRKLSFGELLYATAELVEAEGNKLVLWSYKNSRGEVKLKLDAPPPQLPENSHWDAKDKTLSVKFHVQIGENVIIETPFKVSVIGVKYPELEGIKERMLTKARNWIFKKFLGY
ncbi:MAG: beta-galactosidase [Candidatus Jordarchaeales archaeon]|nr:beta-galactosidase [Candidatus Jordarchaeia archaeon]